MESNPIVRFVADLVDYHSSQDNAGALGPDVVYEWIQEFFQRGNVHYIRRLVKDDESGTMR